MLWAILYSLRSYFLTSSSKADASSCRLAVTSGKSGSAGLIAADLRDSIVEIINIPLTSRLPDQFKYFDFLCVVDRVESTTSIDNNLLNHRSHCWLRLRITPYDLQVQAASVPLAGSMVPHDHLSCFSTVLASTTELAQVTARFATDFR